MRLLFRDALLRAMERRSPEDLERLAQGLERLTGGGNAARIVREIAARKAAARVLVLHSQVSAQSH